MLSPVSGAWFTLLVPAITKPSAGIRSFGLTTTMSPSSQLLDRHLGLGAVATHHRGGGGELGERLDGPAGATHRVALEGVTDAEQRQQQRTLLPLAEQRGAAGGDQHQEVDLEPPVADALDRLPGGEVAAEQLQRR